MLLSGGASAQTVQVLAPVAGFTPTEAGLLPRIREDYGCGRGAGLHFVVRLSAASTADVEVGYTLAGTATTGDDYVDGTGVTRADGSLYSSNLDGSGRGIREGSGPATVCVQVGTARGTGILTITAGDTEGDIFIEVVDDSITAEEDETVVVTLTSASAGAAISTIAGEFSATGTIENDEAEYLLLGRTFAGQDRNFRRGTAANPVRVSEDVVPNSVNTVWHCVFLYESNRITRATSVPFDVTFEWEVEFYGSGPGNAGRSDIGADRGAIIIRTGIDDRGCFEVPLVDDDMMENSERFAVVFRNATPAGRVDFFELNTEEGEYSEFGGLGSSEYDVLPSNRPAGSLGRLDVVIEDDDLGVVISTPSLTFVEGAAVTDANRYTVNLIEAPDRDVTVTPSVSDNPHVTITPATLVFTPATGTVTQTLVVTSTKDSDISESSATINHSVAGLTSATSVLDIDSIQVTIREAAGQTAGVLVSGRNSPNDVGTTNVSITLDECDEGIPIICPGPRTSASYWVVLQGGAPDAGEEVVVTATISSPEHGVAFGEFGFPLDPPNVNTLTFTSTNWETNQEFRVHGRNTHDDDGRDETVVISHTVTTSGGTTPVYASLTTADSATVIIEDNEIDGVSSDAFGSIFHVTELGSTTYEVVLDTDPLEDVVVTISSNDSTAVQVQKSPDAAAEMVTLTFTTSDWDTAQMVTVTAVDDTDADREQVTLSHAVSGYGAVTDAGTVMIVVLDDEATDFAVLYEPADAQLTLVEGGPSKTYDMVLSQAPSVTLTVTPTNSALTITPAAVEFTPANWNVARTVTVSLADDATADSTLTIRHSATPTSELYTASDVTVTVIGNDMDYLLLGRAYFGADRGDRAGTEGTAGDPVRVSEDATGFNTVEHCALLYDSNFARVGNLGIPFQVAFDWEIEFYSSGPGSADRSDIGAVSGTITLPAGTNAGCVRIPLVDDDLLENSERFAVVFRNATPAGRVNFFAGGGGTPEYGGSTENPPHASIRPASSVGRLDVVIEDDEQGVVFNTVPSGFNTPRLTFEEGVAVTDANRYTVNLRMAPDRDVTVTPSADNLNVSVTPTILVFTPETGTVAQTFTVTSVVDSDTVDGTATISHSVAGLTSATSVSDADSIQVTLTEAEGQTMAGILVYSLRQRPHWHHQCPA